MRERRQRPVLWFVVLSVCAWPVAGSNAAGPGGRPLERVSLEVGNGFNLSMYEADREDDEPRRQIHELASPWGERMTVTAEHSSTVLRVLINEELEVVYELGAADRVEAMQVNYEGRSARSLIGDRPDRWLHGATDKSFTEAIDQAAFELLAEGLRREQSEAFFTSLDRSFMAPMEPAGCFLDFLHCAGAASLYIGNLIGIGVSCASITPVCIVALLAHPASATHMGMACADWLSCGDEGGGANEV